MSLKSFFTQIHREGYLFIFIFAIISVIGSVFWSPIGWIFLFLTIWCFYFFRDPERMVPEDKDLVVSPADGLIQNIMEVDAPKELGVKGRRLRISIFLSVMDVHVNRSPIAGEIKKIHYRPGKFLNASLDKASVFNEKNYLLIEAKDGKEVIMSQIAGLIARRIVCSVKAGESVGRGERIGIIRFGSRVDVYLPTSEVPQVVIGQTVVGGETILAKFGVTNKQSSSKV
ncbi:MAG: phosphatidylserine decarboxylase [Rickettsiales bacterium]|nr:phosphatidylserine decarboxylase [Rickettsiales bacterium]